MARARQVKPEFFKDEDLCRRSPLARLLFEGLWTLADRAGRLEDRPIRIKLEILPYDDVDVDALLDELAVPKAHGLGAMIIRYAAADGRRYIQVNNLNRHQHFHPKEPHTTLPGPDTTINKEAAAVPVIPRRAAAVPGSTGASTSGSSIPSIPSGSTRETDLRPAVPVAVPEPPPTHATPAEAKAVALAKLGPRPWSREACDDWGAVLGQPEGDKIGHSLKPLVVKHGWEVVRPLWQEACADGATWDHPGSFTPQLFARSFLARLNGSRGTGPPARAAPSVADRNRVAEAEFLGKLREVKA